VMRMEIGVPAAGPVMAGAPAASLRSGAVSGGGTVRGSDRPAEEREGYHTSSLPAPIPDVVRHRSHLPLTSRRPHEAPPVTAFARRARCRHPDRPLASR
jgi:hypothetical protein